MTTHASHAGTLLCVGCGYDLYALESETVCPECATPIKRSMQGNLLRFASMALTRPLASGSRLLFWAYLAMPFQGILSFVLLFPLLVMGGTVSDQVEQTVSLCLAALICLGWWKLSTPDPAAVTQSDFARSARRARYAIGIFAILSLGVCGLSFASWLANSPLGLSVRGYTSTTTIAEGAQAITRVAHGILVILGLMHLRRIALRIPDARSVGQINDCIAWMKIVLGSLVLMISTGLLFGGSPIGIPLALMFGLIALVVALLAYINLLIVLFRMSRSLDLIKLKTFALQSLEHTGSPPLWTEPPESAHAGSVASIQPPPSTTSGSDRS